MKMRKSTQGFSLLEVILAIVLLALLLAGTLSGITAARRSIQSGEALIDRVGRIRTAQEFLRRQISHIMPLQFARDESSGAIHVFDGNARTLRFVAPMPGYLSRGGPYVQTLELAPGKDGLQLRFSDVMLNGYDPDKSVNDPANTVVLLDRIADGRFEYRSLDVDGNLTDWSSDWRDPEITPLMVRIDLTMQPGVQAPWPTLDVPLMLNAGAIRPRGPMLIHAGGAQ